MSNVPRTPRTQEELEAAKKTAAANAAFMEAKGLSQTAATPVATYNPGAGAVTGGYGSNAFNRAVAFNQAKNAERAQYTNAPTSALGRPERVLWDAQGKIVPSNTVFNSQVARQQAAQQAPGIREGTPQTGMKIVTPYGMVESTPPSPVGRQPYSPAFAGTGPVPSTFGRDRRAALVDTALQQNPLGQRPISPAFAGMGLGPGTFGGDQRAVIANTALQQVSAAPAVSFNAPEPMQPFMSQIRYPGRPGGLSQTAGVKALKRFGRRRVQAAGRFYENATPWFRPGYLE